MIGKNLHGSFVLMPYPLFFFFWPRLVIRKSWLNAPPWTYCVLPTQERASHTSSLSLSFFLPEPVARKAKLSVDRK